LDEFGGPRFRRCPGRLLVKTETKIAPYLRFAVRRTAQRQGRSAHFTPGPHTLTFDSRIARVARRKVPGKAIAAYPTLMQIGMIMTSAP
jgi:hypothetical protein